MRRVVVTGLGAVSCIGNNQAEILDSLKNGRSGIVFNESFAEMGLRSQVSGSCDIDLAEHIDRKIKRFMGDSAAYSYISMQQAIDDSGLEENDISNVRPGLIASSGGASSAEIVRSEKWPSCSVNVSAKTLPSSSNETTIFARSSRARSRPTVTP